MSAGICGKRLGLEEIFGSPSAPAPSAKKLRCCCCGSPIRSADFGFGSEDKISLLLQKFPSMDREVVETVLNSHDNKIEDAIKSLHALCLGDDSARNEAAILNSLIHSNNIITEGSINAQTSEQKIHQDIPNDGLMPESRNPENGSAWVDVFVQEMMNASNRDDVRNCTIKTFEAFQRSVLDQSATSKEASQQEIASLKEQLQCVLSLNQILKKAFSLQHQKNLENEEKLREVQQLKHIIVQYQEQIRTLELNNYSLQVHLQRTQEASSIPGRCHPDVF